MTWSNQPGQDPQQQFQRLEKEFGIQNLKDIKIDEDAGYLYIFTKTKKFRISMTDVTA